MIDSRRDYAQDTLRMLVVSLLILAVHPTGYAQLTKTSNDVPSRAQCQQEAMAWSASDKAVAEAGRYQKDVTYPDLVEHADEMCECAELYPHTDQTATDTLKNPTNFYLPYNLLCTRFQGEATRRLSDFLLRHAECGQKFLSEDAAGLR